MYTTTEKLILAYAIRKYTLNNPEKISTYLLQRSLDIDTKLWPTVYKDILKNMNQSGYTDMIAYCQDKRNEKLVEKINETLRMREMILENKIDPQVFLDSIKLTNLQRQEINKAEFTMHQKTSTKQKNHQVPKINVPFVKPQIKEKVVEPVLSNTEIEVQVDVYDKQNKRYYLKMTQQERDFDDYLDTLDDKYSINEVVNKKNDLIDYFPATGKVKNTQEREKLLNQEYKITRQQNTVGKNRKMSIIELEYNSVVDKIYGYKGGEKDKSAWPTDFKSLLKFIKSFIDKNFETYGEDKRIENIFGQVNKQCLLSGMVLNVLVVLQDLFFKSKNQRLEKVLYEHKKVLIAFYDYYRK